MGENKSKQPRVLVVDDERSVADMIVGYLSEAGYLARAVYSGKEALRVFKAGGFQVVITDLKMPGFDGLSLIAALKKIDNNAVIILISGCGAINNVARAIQLGAYDFIAKPFNREDLIPAVLRAADHHALSAQHRRYKRRLILLAATLPLWFLLGYFIVKI